MDLTLITAFLKDETGAVSPAAAVRLSLVALVAMTLALGGCSAKMRVL